MSRSIFSILLLAVCGALSLATRAGAQSETVIPQGGDGHANQASCVILKRMDPADVTGGRILSFGIWNKQFQYVEGMPEGSLFHGRLTEHDVRDLQGRGVKVVILKSIYTVNDFKQARQQCAEMTGKNPNQTPGGTMPPKQENETPPANSFAQAPTTAPAIVTIESTPPGADIEVDGGFVGNTPSTINIAPGSHEIDVKKKGFTDWSRKLIVTGGSVHLDVTLDAVSAH